ncbi:nitrite reductase (NAD(P)H), partial [Actinotalea fermentans ATCC 43279 = JCM 9966 = DSM 3133]
MVAQRLVEALRARDTAGEWRVTVFAEEPRYPYDRVALTSYFSARDPEELDLGDPALWDDPLVRLVRDCRVDSIDRAARQVTDRLGRVHDYDELVLATGSDAARPPIPGNDLPGVFVYRTIDDVAALRGWVEAKRAERSGASYDRPVRGAVIGGGLLGLEAAGALKALGAQATVVQFGTHLMDAQVDLGGGQALGRLINDRGIAVRVSTATQQMRPARTTGHVGRLDFADGGRLDVDVVVLATGVRPRDEL